MAAVAVGPVTAAAAPRPSATAVNGAAASRLPAAARLLPRQVEIRVVDGITGIPISGARVFLERAGVELPVARAWTNRHGVAVVRVMGRLLHRLTVRARGYAPAHRALGGDRKPKPHQRVPLLPGIRV